MNDDSILDHYGTGYEQDRLNQGTSRIEFARTKELLRRFLPPPPASGTASIWSTWCRSTWSRAIEGEPTLLGLSSHLLVVARKS